MAEKKFLIDNAKLMAEWNWDKNTDLTHNTITLGSHKKVWWKCEKGHEWQATIANRSYGNGCPYCIGKKVLIGYNDLQTVKPNLAKEWNYEKNGELKPENFTANSNKKVWWECEKGHEWQATVYNRNYGYGCPYCSGRNVVKGENDLQTLNPDVAKEWNYERNNNLTPADIAHNSNKKVWWKCEKGHEWQASVCNRNKGNGCPYCSNKKVLEGYNDLKTINPILAKEWNYEKNSLLMPNQITANNSKKVWWKCKKGHEWQATIKSRNKGNGCPVCNSEQRTSFPEYAIIYYLKKYNLDVIHSYRDKGYELDIFIPSKKIAIEYDGYFWHRNKQKKDIEKNCKCKKDGITLYRIREELPPLNDSSFDYIVPKFKKDLPSILKKILSKIVGICVDVNLERDLIAIENLRELTEKENSLLFANPKIASEWNFERNGNLKPEHVMPNSVKKVWWKCTKGHEWQATVDTRNIGSGCPYCAGRKVLKGYNDLQSVNPNLAKEWNYEKNGDLTPEHFTSNSGKKVWWKCKKGHEWQATINNRSNGRGCPYCAGNKVLKGYNDLQSVNPILAKEWNYERNYSLKPEQFTGKSDKRVWWKCSEGHEWQAQIKNRSNGTGCPQCAKENHKANKDI